MMASCRLPLRLAIFFSTTLLSTGSLCPLGVQSGLITDANIRLQGVAADQLRLHSSNPFRTSGERSHTVTIDLDRAEAVTAIAAQGLNVSGSLETFPSFQYEYLDSLGQTITGTQALPAANTTASELIAISVLDTPITTTQLKLFLPSHHPASFRFELYTNCLFQTSFEADEGAGVSNGVVTTTLSSLTLEVRTAVPFPNKALGSTVNAMPAFVIRNTGSEAVRLRADKNIRLETNHSQLDIDLLIKAVNLGPSAHCNISVLDTGTFQFLLQDHAVQLSDGSDLQLIRTTIPTTTSSSLILFVDVAVSDFNNSPSEYQLFFIRAFSSVGCTSSGSYQLNGLCYPCLATLDQYQDEINQPSCKTISPPCNNSQFQELPPSSSNDRTCTSVSPCADDALEIQAPTPTSDRQCQRCLPGSQLVTTTDTTCHVCPVGKVDHDSSSLTACQSCRGVGLYLPTDRLRAGACATFACSRGTIDHDEDMYTACRTCTSGTYMEQAGNTRCLVCQTCEDGEFETQACTASTARKCQSCKACAGEDGTVTPCTATSDTVCQSDELGASSESTSNAEKINMILLVIAIVLPVILIIIIILLLVSNRRQEQRYTSSSHFQSMIPHSPGSTLTSTAPTPSPRGPVDHHDKRMPTPARPTKSSPLSGKQGGNAPVSKGTVMALQGMRYESIPNPDYGEPVSTMDPVSGRPIRALAHSNSYVEHPGPVPVVKELQQYADIDEEAGSHPRTQTLWGRPSIAVVTAYDQHNYEDLPATHEFGFDDSNKAVTWQSEARMPMTQDSSTELYADNEDYNPDDSPTVEPPVTDTIAASSEHDEALGPDDASIDQADGATEAVPHMMMFQVEDEEHI
eukprot:m.190764 g.190764  ORF g.190764 m.190764 type:complete len:855 (-) comp16949_c0_seq2:149-2713(-)